MSFDPGRPDRRPSDVANAQPTGWRQLLAYALPAAPLACLGLPLYALVPTYYTETIGLPLASVGFVLLLIRIFDAAIDPVVGVLSDRFRPRFGRRRLALLVSLPVAAIASVMLYWPPQDAGLAWLGIWGIVLSLGFTMATVPYSAWGAEMATDYQERARLAAYREGLTLVGTLIAIVLPFAIGFGSDLPISGLAWLGILIAVLLPVTGLITIFTVPEPREYSTRRLSLSDSLKYLRGNSAFLRLLAAFFLNGFANGIPATLFLYFVSDRLGLPDARGPLLFLYFLCGIAGVPLANIVAARFGKHRSWCYAMLAACAAFAVAPLLPVGSLYGFAAICAATGLLLGFDLVLPPAIQADVIDVDTVESGEQRSGLYFAAWGLATKVSLAAGVGLVFPLLALFGFAPEQTTANSATALFALAVTYAWIPIVLKLAAIALMWNFPLDEAVQKQLRQTIQDRAES